MRAARAWQYPLAAFRVAVDRRSCDPVADLGRLAGAVIRLRIRRAGAQAALDVARDELALQIARVRALLDELPARQPGLVLADACSVARLGMLEAETLLERARGIGADEPLRMARLKLYLGLMTIRRTLECVRRGREPLWQTLAPLSFTRRAVASFRAALLDQITDEEPEDAAWRLFVIEGELGLLLVQIALVELSERTREQLARLALSLRETYDAGPPPRVRFARGAVIVEDVLRELSEHDELRRSDREVLEQLTALLVCQRVEPGPREVVQSRLISILGLDPELDQIAMRAEAGEPLSYSRLLIRAGEVLSERFGGTWLSGAPPRMG